MTQIRITQITGGTFPISVYISDVYGNNETFLGTITPGPVPPEVDYTAEIPAIFNNAPEVILKMIDANNCQVFQILVCIIGNFIITQNGIVIITQSGNPLIVQ